MKKPQVTIDKYPVWTNCLVIFNPCLLGSYESTVSVRIYRLFTIPAAFGAAKKLRTASRTVISELFLLDPFLCP
jgi:hypothetical protein